MGNKLEQWPIGGCSGVTMLRSFYHLDKEALCKELNQLKENHRCLFACLNNRQDRSTAGEAIREVGGYVIERLSPSYNTYMVIYCIPGTVAMTNKVTSQHHHVDQTKLAMSKPVPKPTKKINWKKRYQRLIARADRAPRKKRRG